MHFIWFWSFWHWSTEGFRSGSLLRSPLQGIASHWDEWYRHEASESEREVIDDIGGNVFDQRKFICWLARRWAREARWRDEMVPGRYVLAQLSRVTPFDKWSAFEKYRSTYAAPGISAIVLNEESDGEAGDVRRLEALSLPLDEDATAGSVVSEGFHAEASDLAAARRAAMSLLAGRGLLVLLGLWLVAGTRPYSRVVRVVLGAGWVAVVALIIRLVIGPDPGKQLAATVGALFAVWVLLVTTALGVIAFVGVKAWLTGRALRKRMEESQIHLRMNGGLSVQGGSAGLAFCLNDLLATYRSHPRLANRSWLWDRFFRNLRLASQTWAATGIVEADGSVGDVVLEPKIRALLRDGRITDVLVPWQPAASQSAIDRITAGTPSPRRMVPSGHLAYGFASTRKLRSHRCRHTAQSVIAVGNFGSKSQVTANVLALAVSAAMVLALPDIRNTLKPPAPPVAVSPGSPSPYYLWVSLNTNQPEAFQAVLESGFWSNRRANVVAYGGEDGSIRAEMRLTRHGRPTTNDEEDGIIWIERRQKFLNREFGPGDRIASIPFAYVTGLRHE